MQMDMTTKERMLNTLECKDIDYIPCSFMLFYNLCEKCTTQEQFIEEEIQMGLDPFVNTGKLRHSLHSDVKYNEWIKKINGKKYFYRKLETPKGDLIQRVVQKNKWPNEDNFPIFNDLIIPRTEEVLVKPEEDLEKIKYIFGSPRKEDIEKLKEEARVAAKIAKKYNLLQVSGCIGWRNLHSDYYRSCKDPGESKSKIVGLDAIAWLSGFEIPMILSLKKPEIIKEYVNIINEWNIKQLEIYLDVTDTDLIVRRAWYETTEFWTPNFYRNIIAPTIKKEADIVHQAGKKYGYIITSAFLPIIDFILDCNIDVLIGLDPIEGKGTDISIVKKKFKEKKKALWGGISGAMTIERGTKKQTEDAVIQAIKLLGKGGSFILSPVDNVSENTEKAWNNTYELISTWKKYRKKLF